MQQDLSEHLLNVLHQIKGHLERMEVHQADNPYTTDWMMIHRLVSMTLEQAPSVYRDLREGARIYLRDYLNFPLNKSAGDDINLKGLVFADNSEWVVTAPRFEGEPVYTVTHVPSGAEFQFNYHELTGDAST